MGRWSFSQDGNSNHQARRVCYWCSLVRTQNFPEACSCYCNPRKITSGPASSFGGPQVAEERLNRQLAMQAKKSKELNELNAKNQELNELSAGAAGLTNWWPGEAMVMNGKG